MKRNIYLTAAVLVTGGLGLNYLSSDSYDTYKPRTEEQKSENIFLTSKERSIKGAIEYYQLLRKDPTTNEVPAGARIKALAQADAMASAKLKKTLPLEWIERGPNNVGGRSRSILVDKRNNNVMYSGGVSGGLFKSTNRAQTWSPVNDMDGANIVTCITQTPDGDIYIGTGEENLLLISELDGEKNSGFEGSGVYRSTDGETFELLASTDPRTPSNRLAWRNVNHMAHDPNNGRLYAGNDQGLYWSEDDGQTWTRVEPSISPLNTGCRQVMVVPNGTVYAHIGSKIYRSTNGKTGYEDITPSGIATARVEMDYSRQDPNWIYFVACNGSNYMSGVRRSKDGGNNWETILGEGSAFFGPLSQLGTTQGQGRFDMCISVDPRDKERIYIGGVQLATWKEGEGEAIIATTFNQDPRNTSYLHADKHRFVWDMTVDPPVMWIASDGGVAVTDFSISSITQRPSYAHMSKGLNIYQSYGVAANEQRHVVSGSQDNGNQLMNFGGNNFKDAVEVFSGDGFNNEYSRINPNILFVESQFGNIARSQNQGESFSLVADERLNSSGGSFPFNTQFRLYEDLSGVDSATFFAVGKSQSIFISPNILDFSVNPIFYKVAEFPGNVGVNYPSDIVFSNDGDELYFSMLSGQLYRVGNLRNASLDSSVVGTNDLVPDVTFEQLNVGSGLPSGRTMTSIGLDPEDTNVMVVTYGNYYSLGEHVYISNNITDANPTFTDITGNLPDVPVYDVEIVYTNEALPKRIIIIGTEIGIYVSENDGNTWVEQNTGFARIPVFTIRAYKFKPWDGYRIYAGSHGRGVFESLSLTAMGVSARSQEVTKALTVYPNPASDVANIKFELNNADDVVISVVNIKGQIVLSNTYRNQTVGEHTYTINTTNLPAGTYFVRVETKSQKGYSKLIVVK